MYVYVYTYIYRRASTHVPWHTFGGQRVSNLRYQFSVPTLLETGSLCCWPLHIPGRLAHERPPLAAITDVCYHAWLCRGSRDLNSGPRACADSTPPRSHFFLQLNSPHFGFELGKDKRKGTRQPHPSVHVCARADPNGPSPKRRTAAGFERGPSASLYRQDKMNTWGSVWCALELGSVLRSLFWNQGDMGGKLEES